jgi:mannose-1-phosphate guanylyltransferase
MHQYACRLVKEQLPGPQRCDARSCRTFRRNTAPCVAYANHVIAKRDPKALIIVAPSDHLVMKEEAFQRDHRLALQQAAAPIALVTLGIMPNRPDTGYGYIQFEEGSGTIHPCESR